MTPYRRTKIVCTIGPACRSVDTLAALIQAGMNVARLNFSHGTHAEHDETVKNIRAAAHKLGVPIAILQDLSGPKLRIGRLATGQIDLRPGRSFTLTLREVPGDESAVMVTYPELVDAATVGQRIILGDGMPELQVVSKNDYDLQCEVISGGLLESNKGITAPGLVLKGGVPTAKDIADLAFGIQHEVDWIAQSFVRSADELRALRQIIRQAGGDIPIIAKIERREAMTDLPAIIAEADGIMVARGDLGLDIGLREVPFAQKQIIRMARAGKPEITATQMLESMITNPRPTRAEANDIANAVLDGSDALMLSGETAVGAYPIEACRIMAEIAVTAEEHIDYAASLCDQSRDSHTSTGAAIAHAACWTAMKIQARVIICCTRSGLTARLVARHRPEAPIAVVSPFESTLRRSLLYWGAYPVRVNTVHNTDQMIDYARQAVLAAGLAEKGAPVVIVAGIPLDSPGKTNMIKADVL